MMSAKVVADTLPNVLADFPEIRLVYLFGSQATGQTGPMSDYDLATLGDSSDEGITLQVRFQHALVQLLNAERVDVVLLNRAPIDWAYHLIAAGKLLYDFDDG